MADECMAEIWRDNSWHRTNCGRKGTYFYLDGTVRLCGTHRNLLRRRGSLRVRKQIAKDKKTVVQTWTLRLKQKEDS